MQTTSPRRKEKKQKKSFFDIENFNFSVFLLPSPSVFLSPYLLPPYLLPPIYFLTSRAKKHTCTKIFLLIFFLHFFLK